MSFARFWWPAKKHDTLKPGLKRKSLNLYAEEYLTMDTINGYVSLSMQPLQATQRQPRAATTGPFRHDKAGALGLIDNLWRMCTLRHQISHDPEVPQPQKLNGKARQDGEAPSMWADAWHLRIIKVGARIVVSDKVTDEVRDDGQCRRKRQVQVQAS